MNRKFINFILKGSLTLATVFLIIAIVTYYIKSSDHSYVYWGFLSMAMYFGFIVIKVSLIDLDIVEARTALAELKILILTQKIEENNKIYKDTLEKFQKHEEEFETDKFYPVNNEQKP